MAEAGVSEDLAEAWHFAEVESGVFIRKLLVVGFEERVWKPLRIYLNLWRQG